MLGYAAPSQSVPPSSGFGPPAEGILNEGVPPGHLQPLVPRTVVTAVVLTRSPLRPLPDPALQQPKHIIAKTLDAIAEVHGMKGDFDNACVWCEKAVEQLSGVFGPQSLVVCVCVCVHARALARLCLLPHCRAPPSFRRHRWSECSKRAWGCITPAG